VGRRLLFLALHSHSVSPTRHPSEGAEKKKRVLQNEKRNMKVRKKKIE
jgi:hypothetical protein